MKKILKYILIGIPLLVIAGIAFVVVGSYFEHQELVEQEKQKYPAPGSLVDVNDDGNHLHVYSSGEGDQTLVFMAGLGTSSPVYDFKALYDHLTDDYRIAVVERAGYGWSDITASPRDIDTVLEETRAALQKSGESPPYVLFPHSMAGLEAIYWANLYPEEITTIIGLDPLVPQYQVQTEEEPALSRIISLLASSGLMRQQPGVCRDNFEAIRKGHLDKEKIEIACSIFFRRTLTDNMWEEADMIPINAKQVLEEGNPEVPFHAFISDEGEAKWKEVLSAYAKNTGGKYYILEAGHYLHLDLPELIAETSTDLITQAIAD